MIAGVIASQLTLIAPTSEPSVEIVYWNTTSGDITFEFTNNNGVDVYLVLYYESTYGGDQLQHETITNSNSGNILTFPTDASGANITYWQVWFVNDAGSSPATEGGCYSNGDCYVY